MSLLMGVVLEWIGVILVIIFLKTSVDVLSWVISHTLGHELQHLTSMVSVFWVSL